VAAITILMMHWFFTAKLDWMSPMCMGNTSSSTPTEPTMAKPTTSSPTTSSAAASEVEATIATIARSHLNLETLESRHLDSLDFHEHACYAIHDALRAAYEAGRQAARRRTGSPAAAPPTVIHGDIIINVDPKAARRGWTTGRIGDFRFCAKVFAEHALEASYEIGRSRISKLELRRIDTGSVAYNWDRGLDIRATDAAAQHAVDRLARHLANHLYGPATA
jgi:hypothetical protein